MIYLDSAATTKVKPQVIEAMGEMMSTHWGNPSSLHAMGLEAEEYIKKARRTIANSIGAQGKNIIFTGSGTEANNLAVLGCQGRGNHYITTAIEHASILEIFKHLQPPEAKITILAVDSQGYVNPDNLKSALTPETKLVSVGMVNSEVGVVQPIANLVGVIKEYDEKILCHTDAIQGWGKIPLDVERLGVDLLTVSGHKVGGPKGLGVLFAKDPRKLEPLIYGGGQEWGLRSGTENTPAIVGLGIAAELLPTPQEILSMQEIKCYFFQRCREELEGIVLNGPTVEAGAPHILNISFLGTKAQVLLQALSTAGIFVSSGSACSVRKKESNHVLKALGKETMLIDGALRFSFSTEHTRAQMDKVISVLKEKVLHLRRIMNYG